MDAVQRADIRAPVAVSTWIPSAAIVPAVDALALLAAAAIASRHWEHQRCKQRH